LCRFGRTTRQDGAEYDDGAEGDDSALEHGGNFDSEVGERSCASPPARADTLYDWWSDSEGDSGLGVGPPCCDYTQLAQPIHLTDLAAPVKAALIRIQLRGQSADWDVL
jgi:hypothetical protein